MRYLILLSVFILFGTVFVSSHLISDQGTNVITQNGTLLDYGNLTIYLYSESSGGNLIFSSTTENAIVNGSWNIMINPTLEYGISYWKDYEINGENLNFDGNDRIEFQSPLGYINNFSFINLSLVNSCPVGTAIRFIYSNGSVICQSLSGNSSTDLTNYALKNQSETFSGNITTTHTGFFGFLGSLASRIGKIFVNEIDASGNIATSENATADYFIGDGSLLTNLPAGSESDPRWTANSTSVLYIANLPLENRTISHINNITGFSFNYNQTSGAVTYVNSQGFLTSSSANATYLLVTDLPLANRTTVHCSNITGSISNLCTVNNGAFTNIFDQILNTTSNVTFESINASREIYVSNIAVKQWLYNQTQISAFNYNQTQSPYFYNQTGNFNYNQTVNPYFYNQTSVLLNNNLSLANNNLSASTGFFGFLGSIANRINKIFAVDLDVSNNLSVNGNASAKFYFGSLNYSLFPSSSCTGTDKVIGVNSSGGVVCGVDQTGSSSVSTKYITLVAEALTDTNAPVAERIVGNSPYISCTNLTGYSTFRYGYSRSATAGVAGAIVYIKYIASPATTITGSSYTNLSNSALQNMVYTAANTANISNSYSMASNLGDVCLAAFQKGGDGAADPQWRNIWVELS